MENTQLKCKWERPRGDGKGVARRKRERRRYIKMIGSSVNPKFIMFRVFRKKCFDFNSRIVKSFKS